MVYKIELCRLSGQKIYPGKGIRFVSSDSQVFLFANSKCKRYFHNKLKPSKLTWTAMYRKHHKKDLAQEAVKKRRRATKKPYSRLLWELLWKLFRRREVRNLKSVMLLERLLFEREIYSHYACVKEEGFRVIEVNTLDWGNGALSTLVLSYSPKSGRAWTHR
ncbi:putative ribosomal protein L24e/L24 superfamily [Helianthus debilis subsp. tardiflorus]